MDARKSAAITRSLVRDGTDPVEHRRAQAAARKRAAEGAFHLVAENWLTFKRREWADETYRKAEFVIRQCLIPPLRNKPISTLATSEVKPVLEAIAAHAPNLATKARQYVGGIVTYAIHHSLREDGVPLSLRGVIPRHEKGGIWVWALAVLHGRPALLGTALLAYTFGLRHAVDADHIAAIDNTRRKLMQDGKRPVAVGFFFSLGHSTIVIALSVAVAFAAVTLKARFEDIRAIGGVISTSVSAGFLLVLAIVNVMILVSVVRTFRRVQRGERLVEADLDMLLDKRGFLSRIFRPLFRLVSKSWHMYPIGFLFGLGFDTATEVALFGISATQSANGMSLATILIFPLLFTAGMCLVDTADGILMLGAYGWAFVKPIRKLYYHITITSVSVVVAVLISGFEALALIADKFALKGAFWDALGAAADHFGLLGYGVIGLFMLSWLVSFAIYKLKRYDELAVDVG